MTRDEMIAFISEHPNVKITHPLFGSEEYLIGKEDGNVYDEKGYLFEDWHSDRNNGLRMRKGDIWEKGWMVKDRVQRYRTTGHITFKGGAVRHVDRVVKAQSYEEANELLQKVFDEGYNYDYTKEYHIDPAHIDETRKPTFDEIKENILIINDLSNSQEDRYKANVTLYKLCRDYEPEFDDDALSDLLSYAEDGSLSECGDVNAMIKSILEDLG